MSGLIKGIVEKSTPDVYAEGDVAPLLVDVNGRALTSIGGVVPALGTDNADNITSAATVDKQVVMARLQALDFVSGNWDRLRSEGNDRDAIAVEALGNLQTLGFGHVYNSVADDWDRIRSASVADGAGATGILASVGFGFNETTFDRLRNNTEVTALASAARTADTTSPLQTNFNARAILILLDVTVNPGGAETLQLILQHGILGGTQRDYLLATADDFGGTTGRQVLIVGLGVGATASIQADGSRTVEGLITREFAIAVSHSSTGSWTYSVKYVLIN